MNLTVVMIALTAAGAVAGTLALVGTQLILQGQQSIADSNAWVNAQNAQWAQYCRENGSQTPGCNGAPPLGPGIDQPQGRQGKQEIQVGQGVVVDAFAPAIATGIFAGVYVWARPKPGTASPTTEAEDPTSGP